jgi:heat shock protein HspQ
MKMAKFEIGAIVKHRVYPFRGVVFDVDATYSNSNDWWDNIPDEVRPATKDQPFYHLLADNAQSSYVAYVAEQNILLDDKADPIRHPDVLDFFDGIKDGKYILSPRSSN